jgi:hypothetical protein
MDPARLLSVPSLIESVTAATAASAAVGSHCGTTWWSVNVMDENPSCSYRRTRSIHEADGRSQKMEPEADPVHACHVRRG